MIRRSNRPKIDWLFCLNSSAADFDGKIRRAKLKDVEFPHAKDCKVEALRFLAMWFCWLDKFPPSGSDPNTATIPCLAVNAGFQALVDKGNGHGFDAMCRLLVSPSYRNTRQPSKLFLKKNQHLLILVKARNHKTGRSVNAVRLTPVAIEHIQLALRMKDYQRDAHALIEADKEVETIRGKKSQLDFVKPVELQKSIEIGRVVSTRAALIKRLIENIDREPFICHFRKKPYGNELRGWTRRLESYFWPNPEYGMKIVSEQAAVFAERGKVIVSASRPWNEKTRKIAEQFAQEIFTWGGVPQRDGNADRIFSVMIKALDGGNTELQDQGAPMNSGWTKVAAFFTAHLDEENRSQVIWDSRVSWSLVRRIDGLIPEGGQDQIHKWVPGIGKVPGRGGTRWTKPLRFIWPNAYAKWRSQFAASDLVREIRDALNDLGVKALDSEGRPCAWSLRKVEMVLFMDGY